MGSMLAAVLKSPAPVEQSPLVFKQIPIPTPGPGEVLIRVKACGICRTDLHVVEGELPPGKTSIVPGHQVVGIVEALGAGVTSPAVGQRVGAAWLRSTCGHCRFCREDRENLCNNSQFNGWTADGGFAQYMTASANFIYAIGENLPDAQAAPLLCAGIIGYRSMRLTGLEVRQWGGWRGARLGLYGFGAAGHVVIQLARGRGAVVYVCTRDPHHQALAGELGAAWTCDATVTPPQKLDAAIIFAPAGELVPPALSALDKGGVLVLGGIHMSDIPAFPYQLIYGERVIRSVANNTRADGHEFMREAAALPVKTHVQVFPFRQVNEALQALKHDAIRGAAVIEMDAPA